ncbi:hypothetical protein D3C87_40240 [compost metagenome]
MSILSTIIEFIDTEKASIASKVIASASYDILKKSINFNALKSKIKHFFKKDAETEEFIETLCSSENITNNDPETEVRNLYNKITNDQLPEALYKEINNWVVENMDRFSAINIGTVSQSSGFNIGVQNANKDIINVLGNYTVNPKKADEN